MFSIKRAKTKSVKKYEYKVIDLLPIAKCYRYLSTAYFKSVLDMLYELERNNTLEDDDIIVFEDTSDNQGIIEFLNAYMLERENMTIHVTLKYNCALNGSNTEMNFCCTIQQLMLYTDNLTVKDYTKFLENAYNSEDFNNETFKSLMPTFYSDRSADKTFNYIERINSEQYILKSFVIDPDNGNIRFLTEDLGDLEYEYSYSKKGFWFVGKSKTITEKFYIDIYRYSNFCGYIYDNDTIVIPNGIQGIYKLFIDKPVIVTFDYISTSCIPLLGTISTIEKQHHLGK